MNTKEYSSYNLKFNLKNKQGRISDRKSWTSSAIAMFLSLCLLLLGIGDLISSNQSISAFDKLNAPLVTSIFLKIEVFDYAIILLGIFIFTKTLLDYLKYKKFIIEKNKAIVTIRNSFGKKRTFIEDLSNYTGIILRVEFVQIGFIAKNKYIIEIAHKDYNKNIPLYISTSDKNIRKIWLDYAKELKLNCVEVSETGVDLKPVKDIDKSIISQVKSGIIKNTYDMYDYIPQTIQLVRAKDKHILKARKFWFDIFNGILSIIAGLFCVLLLLAKAYFVAFIVIALSSLLFGKKDKLVIKKNKLVKVDKYAFFNKKVTEIQKKDIKAVNIDYSPLTNRHFITIYSDNKVIFFAKKMPIDDLRWVKKFLINQIVR